MYVNVVLMVYCFVFIFGIVCEEIDGSGVMIVVD